MIAWFWELLKEMRVDERARVLQFATGLTRIPPSGFAGLKPAFELVVQSAAALQSLPTAHTCFNRLEMPCYKSKSQMSEKLRWATLEGAGSFDLR